VGFFVSLTLKRIPEGCKGVARQRRGKAVPDLPDRQLTHPIWLHQGKLIREHRNQAVPDNRAEHGYWEFLTNTAEWNSSTQQHCKQIFVL